ncbi:hypothetical protein C808_01975 [Lachnospiraceae bacterium M18-1]|nr:hypothetical protein C808_01975 [Lachnospiraceae bacterium M18-1]
MKTRRLLISLVFLFSIQLAALLIFAAQIPDVSQDTIAVNEALQSVQEHWEDLKSHGLDETSGQTDGGLNRGNDARYENPTDLDFVVLNLEGDVLFRTRSGLSESIHEAVIHRDTILDIESNGSIAGKILLYNNNIQIMQARKKTTVFFLSGVLCVQCCIMIWYFFYLNRAVIRPFRKLEGFAERVAGGNLEVPLEMDKENLFGAFTESFDIMRSELKKARIAQAEANAAKKELVAKLSHDIKTPVASIKAASEVGAALTEKISYELAADTPLTQILDNYTQIIRKADQINSLITNLFTATLEELRQLTVAPADMASHELKEIFESADYLHRAVIPHIPDCLLYADRLRLQQVFDNLFSNSYKYAGTKINLAISREERGLSVSMEDFGGGVKMEELPLLKEKFKRGSNAADTEGAGLGLYISDYFLKEMHGNLLLENGRNGLKVTVRIALSGL